MELKQGYARPELPVGTDWLQEHLDDPLVRIVDCGPSDAYRRAHVPGAVGVDDNYFKDPDDRTHVMTAEQIAAEMSGLGIGDDTLVIAYDDFGSLYASRLWWVLSYYGHRDVKVLNGGWHRWLAEGRPVTGKVPTYGPARFSPAADTSILATAEELMETVGASDTVALDVRSIEEYTGENPRGTRRGGHVPGAVHLEWLNFVTSDQSREFKQAAELHGLLRDAGVTADKRIVTY